MAPVYQDSPLVSPSLNLVFQELHSDAVSLDSTPRTPISQNGQEEQQIKTSLLPGMSTHPMFTELVVRVIGAPVTIGQPLKGVELGAKAMRQGALEETVRFIGWDYIDIGDLDLEPRRNYGDILSPDVNDFTDKDGEVNETSKMGQREPDSKRLLKNHNLKSQDGCSLAVHEVYYSRSKIQNCRHIGFGCGQVFNAVRTAGLKKHFSLTIGGDHSIASGSISGMLSVHPNLAVLWVDAHADCNTPDISTSGHYHGMPAAHVMGWFRKKAKGFAWMERRVWEAIGDSDEISSGPYKLDEERIAFIGLRDIDPSESQLMRESKVKFYTMKHVDEMGIAKVVAESLDAIDPDHNRPLYLSFDIDGCDPHIAPGTGTKARGGLTYREAHYICEVLA